MRTIDFYIRKNALKHIVAPLILAILLISLFVRIPFSQIFNPKVLDNVWDIGSAYTVGERYVTVTIDTAYYTGYDVMSGDDINCSYYYCINDNDCMFFLIETDNQPEVLTDYTVTGKLVKHNSIFTTMIESFANDLGWKSSSLLEHSSPVVLDQANYAPGLYTGIMIALIIMLILCSIYIILNLMYIIMPALYPAYCSRNPKNNNKLFGRASEELKNSCICNIENVYITDHYFIDISTHKIIILPLSKIVWVYRLGTTRMASVKKKASYSIYFLMKNGQKITATKKSNDSSNEIIRALQSMNYDIIFGDTENKRRQANEIIMQK